MLSGLVGEMGRVQRCSGRRAAEYCRGAAGKLLPYPLLPRPYGPDWHTPAYRGRRNRCSRACMGRTVHRGLALEQIEVIRLFPRPYGPETWETLRFGQPNSP